MLLRSEVQTECQPLQSDSTVCKIQEIDFGDIPLGAVEERWHYGVGSCCPREEAFGEYSLDREEKRSGSAGDLSPPAPRPIYVTSHGTSVEPLADVTTVAQV